MNKKVVLDAGHGINTAGKRTLNGSSGIIKEWSMNDAVVRYIADFLNDYDVDVYRTDDTTGVRDIPLKERVNRCNSINPDLFISIHHNAAGTTTWNKATGVEVYYHTYGTTEDKKLCNIIAPKLSKATGLRNRGVKHAKFTVLTCKSTAVLVEGGFMDSKLDYDVITSEKNQKNYAVAVAESIVEFLKLKKKVVAAPKQFYQVIVGSYLDRANANVIKAKLEKENYIGVWINAASKDNRIYYQVICGSYSKRENAEEIKQKLDRVYDGVWINVKK